MKGRRWRARAAAAALALGATASPAAAAPASAGYETGLYQGSTEQRTRVGFRAGEWRVKRFHAVLFADCRNGERQRIQIEDGRTAIEDDRFHLELTGDDELAVRIVGRLRDDGATGRIEASVRPPGTACAGTVRWRADRAQAP